jgi:hypothetical protein
MVSVAHCNQRKYVANFILLINIRPARRVAPYHFVTEIVQKSDPSESISQKFDRIQSVITGRRHGMFDQLCCTGNLFSDKTDETLELVSFFFHFIGHSLDFLSKLISFRLISRPFEMSLFGVIVSGRLVQTNFEQVDTAKFLVTIPNADSINHVVLFLTGLQPLPPNMAAAVHFSWPDPNAPPAWRYLGFVCNDKPSAIFKITNLKKGNWFFAF